MDNAELEALLADLESDRSERTTSARSKDKLGEAICAFANDLPRHGLPGYVFVGAHDDGRPSGLPVTDQLLQELAAIRSDGNLLPPPVMNVQKRTLGGVEMAVIEVFPSHLPPVRYRGTAWVRVGPRRARTTEADERALTEKRAGLARTWDAQPCPGAALDDLALGLFEAYKLEAFSAEVLEENHRSLQDQLASLRFLERRNGVPTNAAVLLFGKDVMSLVPGAFVQLVEYGGEGADSDVLRERRYVGDMLSVFRGLTELAEDLGQARLLAIDALRERTLYDYPPEALREAFVNAVIHRDYVSNTPIYIRIFADRIEIQNPGGLYGDLRPEDFPGMTAYRNPILAESAKILGYVNRFGRGIPRISASLARNGSPEALFQPMDRHFLLQLRKPT